MTSLREAARLSGLPVIASSSAAGDEKIRRIIDASRSGYDLSGRLCRKV